LRKVKSFYPSPSDIEAVDELIDCMVGIVLPCFGEVGVFGCG
jgi:hypothetical protein